MVGGCQVVMRIGVGWVGLLGLFKRMEGFCVTPLLVERYTGTVLSHPRATTREQSQYGSEKHEKKRMR